MLFGSSSDNSSEILLVIPMLTPCYVCLLKVRYFHVGCKAGLFVESCRHFLCIWFLLSLVSHPIFVHWLSADFSGMVLYQKDFYFLG